MFQAFAAPFPADSRSACPPPIENGRPRACGSTGRRGRHFRRADSICFKPLAAPFPADSRPACPRSIEGGRPRACGSTGQRSALSGRDFFKLLRRHFRSALSSWPGPLLDSAARTRRAADDRKNCGARGFNPVMRSTIPQPPLCVHVLFSPQRRRRSLEGRRLAGRNSANNDASPISPVAPRQPKRNECGWGHCLLGGAER